jgi:hypothetical protein
MRKHGIAISAVLGLAVCFISVSSVQAFDNSYIEDFTSKQFCDTSGTTAWWDTTAGELKLHPFELAHVGSIHTSGQARGVAVAGDRAYVAYGDGDLQVFNISDPTNPTFIAQLLTRGVAMDVVVAGDHAYVADGTEGLCVINIGSVGFGSSVNTDTPGIAEGVFVTGDYAYIADGDSGLRVFDVTTTAATYVGNLATPDYAMGLHVSGDHAYVAVDDSGLVIIDISDPSNPVLVGQHDTPHWAIDVSVSGKYAFVADYGSGLQVVNVSDPTNPTTTGYCDTDGAALDVAIVGDIAYVADSYSGLAVIDITDPSAPTLVDQYAVGSLCWDVAVAGEHAYLAAHGNGLQVVDICDRLVNLAEMGSGDTPGNSDEVTVEGNYAYVSDMYQGLRIFDISAPGSPAGAGSFSLNTWIKGRARHVEVAGRYAYIAYEDSGVVVVDVSDPMNPTWAGSYISSGGAHDLNIEGDYLYVGDGSAFFQVLDISDPANPSYVGSYDPAPGSVVGIDVDGNIACAVDNILDEMVILDISNPASPTVMSTYTPLGGPLEVDINGDYAFVADYNLGILAIDITDPAAPVLLDSITTPGHPYDIVVDGDYAVVADQSAGVTILDVSDPTNLAIDETLDIGICHGLTLAGDYIYAADQHPGLAEIKMYDRHFDVHRNTARSLAFYESSDQALKVRLATTQSDWVGWWVSGDMGIFWTYVEPAGGWYSVSAPGTTLHWLSIHVPFYTGVNPSCSDLTVEWLYEHALIDSIVDIPADQGGRVRIYFTRSGWDFGEGELPITTYNIWRRIDSPGLTVMLRAARPESEAALRSELGVPMLAHDGRAYLMNEGGMVCSGFPPGVWEVLGSFAAVQQDQYIYPAATLVDSTVAGVEYSVYCISAHTAMPSVWYVSPPDSGYSIDNIAPAPPPNLRMESSVDVAWDMVPDEDFQYYTVYGTDSPEFGDDPVLIDFTIDLGLDVSGNIYSYYHVTATDYAGNEGSPSTVENTFTGLPSGKNLPKVFALSRIKPNPFTDKTEVAFDLPVPVHVSLKVFDAAGRLVKILVEADTPAGHHSVSWSAKGVSAGVYFVKIEAADFKATCKVLLTR